MNMPFSDGLILKSTGRVCRVFLFVMFIAGSVLGAGFTDNHGNNDYLKDSDGETWKNKNTGGWTETSGHVTHAAPMSFNGILISDYPCKDAGIIEVNMTLAATNRRYSGVIFRYSSNTSFYYVYFSTAGAISELKIVNGSISTTIGTRIASNLTLPGSFTLKIEIIGNDFTFYVNNSQVGSKYTDAGNDYPSGRVGYGYASGVWSGLANYFNSITWTEDGKKPPEITTHPKSKTGQIGGSVTFNVVATGDPVITNYIWKKNGTTVKSGVNATSYTIDPVAMNHEGTYAVSVVNDSGITVSNNAVLKIAAHIETDPVDQVVLLDDDATFSVVALGSTPLSYGWEKNDGSGWSNVGGNNSTYIHTNSQVAHDGYKFRCEVTGYNNTKDLSGEASLSVTAAAEITKEPITPREAAVGDSVIFSVAAFGTIPITYIWEYLNNGTWETVGSNKNVFVIDPVDMSHDGDYRVRVKNLHGEDISVIIKLTVCEYPLIIQDPLPYIAEENSIVLFKVKAIGTPLVYQWQRAENTTFTDIAGADSDSLEFTASVSDDGDIFRCIVSACDSSDTSKKAVFTLGVKPDVSNQFPYDTVIPTGNSLAFTGVASGVPQPVLEWFFLASASATPVSKFMGDMFVLSAAEKSDSGYLFFNASNSFGNASSDSIFVNVMNPVVIDADLPSSQQIVEGAALVLSFSVKGDISISYQWYENDKIMQNEKQKELSISSIDSATHDGNIYHCVVSNSHNGVDIGRDTTNKCKLVLSKFYNPFQMSVKRIDEHNTTHVKVKVWSDVDISKFPSTQSLTIWADSLYLMYKSKDYVTDVSEASVHKFSTNIIKTGGAIEKTVQVGVLPDGHDSLFYFSHTILWHNPGNPDILLRPYKEIGSVFLVDTIAPPNPLKIHGIYIQKTDSALLVIDSIQKLKADYDSMVIVQTSLFKGFDPILSIDTLSVTSLLSSGQVTDTIVVDPIGKLPIKKKKMYCRWHIVGKNSGVGKTDDIYFYVGWDRPVYSGTLTADSTVWSSKMYMEWDLPDDGTEAVRIWWDDKPIDTTWNITLPISQAHDVKEPMSMTFDTIFGLTDNTLYYFGLQILKDGFWSKITKNSRTSMTTSAGDTSTVLNIIKVDFVWFDAATNKIKVAWHIDLDNLEEGESYESNYQIGFSDSDVVQKKPTTLWTPITLVSDTSEIEVSGGIVFDTTYVVGMWLRGISAMGTGQPSPPTDTSIISIKIPSFTWEVVTIFPDSDTITSVKAVGGNVVFKIKDTKFSITDTLKNYILDTPLPNGLIDINSVKFTFKPMEVQIAPIILGLKFTNLPGYIKTKDLALYQIKNGLVHIVYGSWVKNGFVWCAVGNENMAYPFLVLADKAIPKIIVDTYKDTVEYGKNKNVPVVFTIEDNIANSKWDLMYGSGNKGYYYNVNDTAKTYSHKVKTHINGNDDIINKSFGVRAKIVVSDGINTTSKDMSLCVRSDEEDNILNLIPQKWVPLRVASGVKEKSLKKTFRNSITGSEPWKYDKYKYRIYRWYNAKSEKDDNKWVEYSDKDSEIFDFYPGRVIWCKSKEEQHLNFGEIVTTTLKEPFRIKLKPKNWTDISLPFKFDIYLKDVLYKTGAIAEDSLEIHYWEKNDSSYNTQSLYIGHLDKISNDTNVLHSGYLRDAYTIYNGSSKSVDLLIPPISLPLSKNTPLRKRVINRDAFWDISFCWKEKSAGHTGKFRSVRCCYKKDMPAKQTFGPLPPGMGDASVGIVDTAKNTIHGWCAQNSIDRGGVVFKIAMSSSKNIEIEYCLNNLTELPEGIFAKVLDYKNMIFEETGKNNTSTISVSSSRKSEKYVIIGNSYFFDKVLNWISPLKLTLLKIFPNPFNNRIKIQYRLPSGIKEVRFTLYDMRGRTLWKGIERKNISKGNHTFLFDNRNNDNDNSRVLSAGVYIVQLKAVDVSNKIIYGGKKQVTCLK